MVAAGPLMPIKSGATWEPLFHRVYQWGGTDLSSGMSGGAEDVMPVRPCFGAGKRPAEVAIDDGLERGLRQYHRALLSSMDDGFGSVSSSRQNASMTPRRPLNATPRAGAMAALRQPRRRLREEQRR